MIIINARFLTQPITGVQRFAIEICKELKKLNISLIFVSPRNIVHADLAKEFDVQIIGNFRGHLWEQIDLQMFALRKKALLVSLCNTGPLFLKNQVVTIHDLSFRKHPEWFSFLFSTFYNFIIPKIIKRAKHVITVSESAKLEIVQELNVDIDKVSVIYNAVPKVFVSNEKHENVFKNNILLKEKYLLSVSSHHPRKNFERLIQGFIMLNDSSLKLYIIGNFNKNFSVKSFNGLDLSQVVLLENITDLELVDYYRNACLFVFPSVYEGFGIPIVEAISQNVPICVSDIPVFHEICNDEATYFNPLSPMDICNKIQSALIHKRLVNKSILERFSWAKGASKIKEIIDQLIIS